MEIGKQIQKIRKENNLSQEQFGKRFHVTRQFPIGKMKKVILVLRQDLVQGKMRFSSS